MEGALVKSSALQLELARLMSQGECYWVIIAHHLQKNIYVHSMLPKKLHDFLYFFLKKIISLVQILHL